MMTLDLGLLALFGVLVLTLSGLHWWMRARGERSGGPIRVVASQGLGAKRALAIVEIEGKRLLLGLTDERIACLAELEKPVSLPRLAPVARVGGTS